MQNDMRVKAAFCCRVVELILVLIDGRLPKRRRAVKARLQTAQGTTSELLVCRAAVCAVCAACCYSLLFVRYLAPTSCFSSAVLVKRHGSGPVVLFSFVLVELVGCTP